MTPFRVEDGALHWRWEHELLRIEPWGADGLRVRAGLHTIRDDLPGALLASEAAETSIAVKDDHAVVECGALRAVVTEKGLVRFERTGDGAELLAEERAHFWWGGPRLFLAEGGGAHRLEQRFRAYAGEKLFGLGQHTHGRLDQKGLVIDLQQKNAEVGVPFLVSSRGYGLLWNNPAVGRVELADNGTRWVADSARQIDYWITAGSDPAAILANYAGATGHAPPLPEWASGFWQSKLRYRTQEELLEVAREYRRRGLPLSVIVSDFFHWNQLGEWRFHPGEWPDPAAMVRELESMGVKLMVSVWPTVSPTSENYPEMQQGGLLVGTERGLPYHATWKDRGFTTRLPVAFYDPTNPEARAYIWDKVKRNYYDIGVRVWWLDACEPEIHPGHPAHLSFHGGPGAEVFNAYPRDHARGFYEGMRAAGETEIVNLCRSAWAGSQRWGAALWSGDIPATFDSLARQVRAGLNVAMSGLPWWTTDIGGFHGGDPDDPAYRELMVRWFQYGVFCPLFRLHGDREPRTGLGPEMTGGPNEVWSFGDEAYEVITGVLRLRERIRPYLMAQMHLAHERGTPPMRPLFVDFPGDAAAWAVEDEFMLGPDILVAPVLEAGATEREVYLPEGTGWTDAWTGEPRDGGSRLTAAAPLDRIPVYLRQGAEVPMAEE